MDSGFSLGAALAALVLGGVVFVVIKVVWGAALLGRKTSHRVGDSMQNTRAVVVDWSGGQGAVRAGGELWRAVSRDALAPGDAVAVTRVDGLTLEVRKKQ